MWLFCLRSLAQEYGWQFFRRVAGPHPLRTARAVLAAGALDRSGHATRLPPGDPAPSLDPGRSVLGLGFCLKPMIPPCPSGRPNHDCQYLENLQRQDGRVVPDPCRRCAIREIGLLAMESGTAVYIMTSARDILFDVFVPALERGLFTSGLFALCGYSIRPFAVGLLASGVRGWLFPFEQGDCQNYRTWLLADRGFKDEQTTLAVPMHRTMRGLLEAAARETAPATRFDKRGHVLFPVPADGPSPEDSASARGASRFTAGLT